MEPSSNGARRRRGSRCSGAPGATRYRRSARWAMGARRGDPAAAAGGGAVAATPLRLTAVETAVAGKPRNEETADVAGRLAVEGAQPLRYNGYKIPLMRNLVKRAIRGAGQATT